MQRRKPLRSMSPKRLAAFKAGMLKGPLQKAAKEYRPKKMRPRAKGNSGQMEAFHKVWDDPERPHVCEVCGRPLFERPDDMGDREAVEVWVRQMSHLLPKGSYRRAKTKTKNIRLHCYECHDTWHEFKDLGLRGNPLWWRTFELYDELIAEENGVR